MNEKRSCFATGEDILRQARVRPAVSVQDQEEWVAEAGFQEKLAGFHEKVALAGFQDPLSVA